MTIRVLGVSRGLKGWVGALALAVTMGAWAQGGGEPVSVEQASAIVAAKAQDKRLATDVRAAITGAGVDGAKLRVRAYHGVVTLRGSVPSAQQAQAASSAAVSVQGVAQLRNRLRVRP